MSLGSSGVLWAASQQLEEASEMEMALPLQRGLLTLPSSHFHCEKKKKKIAESPFQLIKLLSFS